MKSEPMEPITAVAVIGSLITSISALILGLAGIWAQNKRDAKQAKLDTEKAEAQNELDKGRLDLERDKADEDAKQATIATLREEITRLQENQAKDRARILELEAMELDKIEKIGQLMMAKIDAESEAATMRYKMEAMQMKLNALLPQEVSDKKRKEETVPLAIRKTLETNKNRKALVEEEMYKEMEEFKSGSLANGGTTPPEGE